MTIDRKKIILKYLFKNKHETEPIPIFEIIKQWTVKDVQETLFSLEHDDKFINTNQIHHLIGSNTCSEKYSINDIVAIITIKGQDYYKENYGQIFRDRQLSIITKPAMLFLTVVSVGLAVFSFFLHLSSENKLNTIEQTEIKLQVRIDSIVRNSPTKGQNNITLPLGQKEEQLIENHKDKLK